MLFLGLGTGLGSALISGHVVVPLELGQLFYRKRTRITDVLGRKGLARLGKNVWREKVNEICVVLHSAFCVDYIVLGGGNAELVRHLPPGTRRGNNLTAFRGGMRAWSVDDVPTQSDNAAMPTPPQPPAEWRIV